MDQQGPEGKKARTWEGRRASWQGGMRRRERENQTAKGQGLGSKGGEGARARRQEHARAQGEDMGQEERAREWGGKGARGCGVRWWGGMGWEGQGARGKTVRSEGQKGEEAGGEGVEEWRQEDKDMTGCRGEGRWQECHNRVGVGGGDDWTCNRHFFDRKFIKNLTNSFPPLPNLTIFLEERTVSEVSI